MLTTEPTPESVKEWKRIYLEYKDKLIPNAKSPDDMVKYLEGVYPLLRINSEEYKQIVSDNICSNEFYRNKLKENEKPEPVVFELIKSGSGLEVYNRQDDVFRGLKIIIGIDLTTGFFFVEGSGYIWDELLAFRGLDEYDVGNFFLVAEYIRALRIFDRDNDILK